ncbi:potassium channel family protein [Vibrio marisflavi]|uniref:PH-gated potassium channel KcsA n=1 Tax=Vibrio marisflavi CECT 7928 TaxID=634439 RepID=A0ABN8E7H5_9VIBR|nr:potassium channel family protein [Vibrio marisflavi]CAH0539913.1 pH-gated potassium channel KcsA [Vibrio marisflavi CECT 7928]
MGIIDKIVNKLGCYKIDEFGVKNYNYRVIGFLALLLYLLLTIFLGLIAFFAEVKAPHSNITSVGDAIWLMFMSSSTIGFGDHYPVTIVGRLAVFTMFLFGVGILGVVGSLYAKRMLGFSDTGVKNRELRKQNREILKRLKLLEEKIEQSTRSSTSKHE